MLSTGKWAPHSNTSTCIHPDNTMNIIRGTKTIETDFLAGAVIWKGIHQFQAIYWRTPWSSDNLLKSFLLFTNHLCNLVGSRVPRTQGGKSGKLVCDREVGLLVVSLFSRTTWATLATSDFRLAVVCCPDSGLTDRHMSKLLMMSSTVLAHLLAVCAEWNETLAPWWRIISFR